MAKKQPKTPEERMMEVLKAHENGFLFPFLRLVLSHPNCPVKTTADVIRTLIADRDQLQGRVDVLEWLVGLMPTVPVRWRLCEECGGSGMVTYSKGERQCAGVGGPYEQAIGERKCEAHRCDDGGVKVEWHEEDYQDAAKDHPRDC
jgi:hypothetical protein